MTTALRDNEMLELRIAMLRAGVRQIDVAQHLGVTPAAISQVLKGQTTSARIVQAIREFIAYRPGSKQRAS